MDKPHLSLLVLALVRRKEARLIQRSILENRMACLGKNRKTAVFLNLFCH